MIMLRPDLQDCKLPKFTPGDLVRHVRYQYRGVVVAHDPKCMADENWYRSNKTQPDRDQPWYHVLVHGGQHSTYVAEENLQPDEGREQVVHPLTNHFFQSFAQGRYQPRDNVTFPNVHGDNDEIGTPDD